MPALLCALLIVFPQDPPVDDIAKRFPDPVAADRTWEMAAAYFEKICGHLRAKEYDEAREWERMARGRLPDPYAKRLAEKGREFWPKFRGFPGNRVEVEDAAAVYVIALIGGDERELAVLKKRVGNDHETRRIIYGFDLAVALTRIGEGELPKALRHFDEMEKFYPEEWVKNALAEKRAAVAAIGEAGSAEGVLKSTGLACWSRETSWGGSLAVLERVRAGLKKGPPAAARKPLMEAAIYVLRSLEDPKAVRAFEDRLAHDPVSSPKESRALMAKRAGEAFQRGDYKLAEALYRQVLNQWPDEPAMGIGFQLGRALQKQEKWAEARGVFEKIAAAKDEDGPREERGFGPKVQDRARFEIGACYEGAGQWAKALAAYLACPDVPRGDGHGREYRDLSIPEAVFRCRVNLKQVDEAMKLGRDHVLETGRRSKHIVVGFIDLAVASGKFDAEEEKLKAVVPKEQPGVGMALDYMRVLKLRRDRDIAGLFAAIKDENLHQDLYQARWEVLRDGASWLTAETVECLAELGDAAVDYLQPIARLGVGRAYVALLALCRIRTERAQKLMENLEWVQSHLVQDAGRFKNLAKGERVVRSRLPEKPAAAPDPREAAKRKERAAKVRELLPELTAKVKGVDEMLALETDAGRMQALGETIFAWKKGAIVDEDLQDLVTFALEDKWALDPQPLQTLIRNNRAAPAAPLVERGLTSKDARVRAEAAEILGSFQYSKAIPQIALLLDDPDREVAVKAMDVLVWFKSKEHVPQIAAFLKLKSDGRATRAINALAALGAVEHADAIAEFLDGKDIHQKAAAIQALGRLGSVKHADAIAGFLDSEDAHQRVAAVEALGKLGAQKHADGIRKLLKDKNEWVRKAAEQALKILEK